ncbi:MAG: hypothetical protein J6Z45_03725 [Oscillospiraceae bacterium]|nr:hypothetical protein [Oscillospiraceae bacterium]
MQTKRKGKGVLIVIIILAILALLVFLAFKLGWLKGLGFGKGEGDGGSGVSTSQQTDEPASTADTTVEQVASVEVTVSGSSYLYQNKTTELEALITELTKLDKNTRVKLHDENAAKNTYDALTKALKDNNIPYDEVKPE